MTKPKMVIWSDLIAPTGYANVAKNLFKDLHLNYDIHVVAINSKDPNKLATIPLKSITHSLDPDEPMNGPELINKIQELMPEYVLLFQDIYHIENVIPRIKEVSPSTKIVSYFPIDGAPQYYNYAKTFEFSDAIITYTDWAVNILKAYVPASKDKKIEVLYHGVNQESFHPLPDKIISELKKQIKWDNKLCFINVNTFQPRKQLALTLRAFSMFAKGYKKCNSCKHEMPNNVPMCELCHSSKLINKGKPKNDVHLYMHTMPYNWSMGTYPAEHLGVGVINAGFSLEEDYGRLVSINNANIPKGEVPEKILNQIYNCADYNLTTTVGEGAGLSLLESAAVGVPSIAPKNSAIPEMLSNTGYMVKNSAVVTMKQDNGQVRPVVDLKEYRKTLDKVYNKWKREGKKKVFDPNLVIRINDKFTWEDKREKLNAILSTLQ